MCSSRDRSFLLGPDVPPGGGWVTEPFGGARAWCSGLLLHLDVPGGQDGGDLPLHEGPGHARAHQGAALPAGAVHLPGRVLLLPDAPLRAREAELVGRRRRALDEVSVLQTAPTQRAAQRSPAPDGPGPRPRRVRSRLLLGQAGGVCDEEEGRHGGGSRGRELRGHGTGVGGGKPRFHTVHLGGRAPLPVEVRR